MGQIVRRKKKGRPSKLDLPADDLSPLHQKKSLPERWFLRRSSRRRSFRYNLVDSDDDEGEFEEEEEEEEEEEMRREKKMKLVVKLPCNRQSSMSRRRVTADESEVDEEEEEEEEEERPVKKRMLKLDVADEFDEENEVLDFECCGSEC